MKRSIPGLIAATLAALPVVSLGVVQPALAAGQKTATKTYKGPSVDMRWGPVQATIKVKGKKITSVSIGVSPDTRRSEFLDAQAVPILKQETLQTQNANIDTVSGATMTSEAYIQSLQQALSKAHLPTG